MTPPDHVGDDPVPHAGGGAQGLSTARLTGLLNGTYALKRPEDPRAYGLTGGADDSAALQACLNAAGVGGSVELPKLTINTRSTLTIPAGCEVRGTGPKGSVLATDRDITVLSNVGGEEFALKNFKVANSFAGTRTTYDIEIVNPFKPVLEHVEVALGQSSLVKGGVHIYKDAGQAGASQSFMPQLNDVWVRNGVLLIENVTDGKVENCYLWGTYTGAPGTVELKGASNWTFSNVDIVPPQGDSAGYLISAGLNNLTIVGGLMDGSYDDIMTGHGIKSTDYIRGLTVTGVKFFNLGRSGVKLFDVRRSVMVGNVFVQCNKADSGYPDVDLYSCNGNVFMGNTHGAPNTRTNTARLYVEDGNSADNLISSNAVEISSAIAPNGHYYNPGMFTVQTSTRVKDNRPDTNWPQTALLAKSANYTISKFDLFEKRTIHATGTVTMTLPSAGSVHSGDQIVIKNTGSGAVTIATTSSQTIDGTTPVALTAGQARTYQSDGTGWRIVAGFG